MSSADLCECPRALCGWFNFDTRLIYETEISLVVANPSRAYVNQLRHSSRQTAIHR